MSRRPSSRQAVEIVWQSMYEPTVDPEPALDTLREKYENGNGIMEYFAGQFYHLSRSAYAAIAQNDVANAMGVFSDSARYLLRDVMEVIDGDARHHKTTDFYGVANELTPAAIGPMYLPSREADLYHKTDLLFVDTDRVIPVQMKTDECYTIAAAPQNGVLVTAKDFGNEDFAVSRAIVDSETFSSARNTAVINVATRALTECIQRRANDPALQEKELAYKAGQVRGPKHKTPPVPPLLHSPFATDAMSNLFAVLSAEPQPF